MTEPTNHDILDFEAMLHEGGDEGEADYYAALEAERERELIDELRFTQRERDQLRAENQQLWDRNHALHWGLRTALQFMGKAMEEGALQNNGWPAKDALTKLTGLMDANTGPLAPDADKQEAS